MGKSQKFEELAEQVMPLLGGRDNITWFSHCVTRLRFTVKDHGLVDKDGIDALKGAIGSQWAGDQYQIIVGPDVEEAYSAILARGEISGDMAPAAGDAAKPASVRWALWPVPSSMRSQAASRRSFPCWSVPACSVSCLSFWSSSASSRATIRPM